MDSVRRNARVAAHLPTTRRVYGSGTGRVKAPVARTGTLGSAGELPGELGELTRIHVRDERVAEIAVAPQDHVEATGTRHGGLHRTHGCQSARLPGDTVGAEDEE